MKYEVVESRTTPGEWKIEAIDHQCGEIHVTIFSGPDAMARAAEYAVWKNQPPRPHCCAIGCGANADFLIVAVRRDGKPVGPDPYSDNTHACEHHVGLLLGHQDDAEETDDIEYRVIPLCCKANQPAAIPTVPDTDELRDWERRQGH